MTVLLALMMASNLAPGCSAIGSMVHCELAPQSAAEASAVPPVVRSAEPRIAVMSRAQAPRPIRRRAQQGATGVQPIDEATVQAHMASLVSIGDCTGARTYATLIGETALADQTFRACIGMGPAVPATLASAP
jgi:hypothetical protein